MFNFRNAIHSKEKTETEHSSGLYSGETFRLVRAYHALCNYVFLFHTSIFESNAHAHNTLCSGKKCC